VKILDWFVCLSLVALLYATAISANASASPFPLSNVDLMVGQLFAEGELSMKTVEDSVWLICAFHKLEGRASAEGLWLNPTADGQVRDRLRVKATAFGRGEELSPITARGKVVTYESLTRWIRPHLVEEYSVSVDGVRQDFILLEKPAGAGDLCLELSITGANAEPDAGGAMLTFNKSGRRLAYSKLHVTDANGIDIASRMEVSDPTRLAILVDDWSAVYPLRIDPTFSDADWQNMSKSLPGANNTVHDMVTDTNAGLVYACGSFSFIGSVQASGVAKWNGSSWTNLGSGVLSASTMTIDSAGNLFIGGDFTSAGGISANRIAKWNGSSWVNLGSGMNARVRALAVLGDVLYAGGEFTEAGGNPISYVAAWDGNSWTNLNEGVNNEVYALAADQTGNLYVGGAFSFAGDVVAGKVARWTGNSWTNLGDGMNGTVLDLIVDGSGILYAGGNFWQAGGIDANNIATWTGTDWTNLGNGFSSWVYSLAIDGEDKVIASGDFTNSGTHAAARIAKWNGSSWTNLGSGMDGQVRAIAVDTNGAIFAGGSFLSAGGIGANYIAQWHGNTWTNFGTGFNNPIYAIVADSAGKIYVGGAFTYIGGLKVNNVAIWSGGQWWPLGSGMNGPVQTLAFDDTGFLYAGGAFTTAGNTNASRIARWTGFEWLNLGSGVNDVVDAITVDSSNRVYVGGRFTTAGGMQANRIARWSGNSWTNLGSGLSNRVYALCTDTENNVYAGGQFTAAGGSPANRVAKWNGNSWTNLGIGMDQSVFALAAGEAGSVYAYGQFNSAGGFAATSIAQWTGTAWTNLGLGIQFSGSIGALLLDDYGRLYVGGSFISAGGQTANRIARWNGTAWTSLGSGLNNSVFALALQSDSNLYVGGQFTAAGGKVSLYLAKATAYPDPVPGIVLLGTNGTVIMHQDLEPDLADGTDFGEVNIPGPPVIMTFSITNSGESDVIISQVLISGAYQGEFTVTGYPAVISPQTKSNLVISFNSADEGSRTAIISIYNNDTNHNPYLVAVQGAGYILPAYRPGRLNFQQSEIMTPENKPTLAVSVERTNGTFGSVTAEYVTSNNTASAGTDYVAVTGVLFFADGQAIASLVLGTLDDVVFEGEENFTLHLQTPGGGAKLGGQSNILIRIQDNDVPGTLNLAITNLSVEEGAGQVVLRVERSDGAVGAVSVVYTTLPGTAVAGSDFTTTAGTLHFSAQEFNASVAVPLIDNGTGEGLEKFTFRLQNPGGGAVLGMATSAVVEIVDDDQSIAFTASKYTIMEGASGGVARIYLRRKGDVSGSASVAYSTVPGTATDGSDFVSVDGVVSFDPGESTDYFQVPIIDDATVGEPTEQFTAVLSNQSAGVSLGAPRSCVVEITDNDRIIFQQNFSSGLPAGWKVKANKHPKGIWRFDDPKSRGNKTGGSGKYAIADSDFAGRENMDTELISPNLSFSGYSQVTLRFAFDFHVAFHSYGNTLETCDVDISQKGNNGPWINVWRRNGSEYRGPRTEIVDLTSWLAGRPVGAIRFHYYDAYYDWWWQVDDIKLIGIRSAESQAGSLSMASATTLAPEHSGNVVIDVIRIGGNDGTVGGTITTAPVSATPGSDYVHVNTNFSLPDGVESVSVVVRLLDDVLNEGAELFRAVLSNPTGGASLGIIKTNMVTILDDEGLIADAGVSLHVPSNPIMIASNFAYVVAASNNGPSAASSVVVQYQLPPSAFLVSTSMSKGLASNTAGLFVWNVGSLDPFEEVSAMLNIRLMQVGYVTNQVGIENDEADGVSGNNQLVVTGEVRSAGVLQFGSPVYTMTESGPAISVDVIRTEDTFEPASVNYSTIDDSAIGGNDYTSTNGVLIFADGDVSQSIQIQPINDVTIEGSEFLYIQLVGVVGASLGADIAAISIIDDDVLALLASESFEAQGFSSRNNTLMDMGSSVWSIFTNSGLSGWRFDDPGSRGNQTGGTGGFAIADSDYAGGIGMDTELRSPVYSLVDSLGAIVEFKSDLVSSQALALVQVSTNGSAGPWTITWDSKSQPLPGPQTVVVDIGTVAAGNSNVMVGFRYLNATNDGWWAVDDVRILGDEDADGDQLPDWWETLYFGGTAAQSATNDYDLDDASNLDEFYADTSPTNTTFGPAIIEVVVSNDTTTIFFEGSPNRLYDIESSSAITGDWEEIESSLQGAGQIQYSPVKNLLTNEFYRLRIRPY